MYAAYEPLSELLVRVRLYCDSVVPGDPPVCLRIKLASGQRIEHPIPATPLPPPVARPRKPPRCASLDFRSVQWYGTSYSFTATQAACVKVLWEAFEGGAEELGQAIILIEAGSDCERLSPLFIGHPAWGVMIVAGRSKGSYRLQAPPDADLPAGTPPG